MRHEITFSYFNEESGTYIEVTVPGNVKYADVAVAFERFVRSLGYMELTRKLPPPDHPPLVSATSHDKRLLRLLKNPASSCGKDTEDESALSVPTNS